MEKLYNSIYNSLDRRDYTAARKYIEELAPHDPVEAARLMVSLYIEQEDSRGAMQAWGKLDTLLPHDFFTQFLHARILFMEKRYVSAYKELKDIQLPSDKVYGYGEKIANLMGQCCRILGKTDEAAQAYNKASEWASEQALKAMEYSNYLFNLHYSGSHSAEYLRQQAEGFGQLFHGVEIFKQHPRRDLDKPLRIGYLSPDIRHHVVLCFCYDLLTAYSRDKFEVYVYMLGPEDEYSDKIRRHVAGWRNLRGMPFHDAARVIHDDEIDILVDLAGHTKGNGLPIMAYKPAPVQISGIGYFASTGLDAVDYFLGDCSLDGDGASHEFVEDLIVLPHSHFCYRPLHNVPLPQEAPFLRNGYVTFGSFNNFAKVTDEVLAVWNKILMAVPQSHLLLKASVFDGGETEAYTRERLLKAGLPMDRVECRGFSEDYLSSYGDMDIALDTFPYPGGGTSCDALYMGRPLISLVGKSHGERFGYSLLKNLGLGELAAFSEDEYISRAVMLAEDRELLAGLQKSIRSMMQKSPLMDSRLYIQEMEAAYSAAWEKYELGQRK